MAEDNKEKLHIRLHVYDTEMPVMVPKEEEPLYRDAAVLITNTVNAYASVFKGHKSDKELLYKANFHCRTALRILKPIYHFKAKDADTVYKEVKKVEWEKYLSLDKTFAIDSVIYSEDFNHSKFVAYRTKDAIVDYFIEKFKKRPSVRVNNPDLYINIHISHNDCTLSIDSSGESLHKRGYRVDQTEAPLNEVLAAGMILKTGWKGDSNFVDPMCRGCHDRLEYRSGYPSERVRFPEMGGL